MCVHVPVGTSVGQIVSDLLELETAVSSLIQVLATELRSSARAESALLTAVPLLSSLSFFQPLVHERLLYQFINILLVIQSHGSVLVCHIFIQSTLLCVYLWLNWEMLEYIKYDLKIHTIIWFMIHIFTHFKSNHMRTLEGNSYENIILLTLYKQNCKIFTDILIWKDRLHKHPNK